MTMHVINEQVGDCLVLLARRGAARRLFLLLRLERKCKCAQIKTRFHLEDFHFVTNTFLNLFTYVRLFVDFMSFTLYFKQFIYL